MPTFVSNYMSLAGPSVMAALFTGAIAYVLLGGRDFAVPSGRLWQVAGTGVVAAVVASVVLALLGVTSSNIPLVVGVVVGVLAASFMRDPPASK